MNAAPRNVLVAIDGSVASLKAARVAMSLAASCRGRVRMVAVADEESERAPPDALGTGTQTAETRQTQLRDSLEYLRRLGADGGLDVEAVLRHRRGAEPYELILEEADRWPADLLCVGRRSHRGLGRALLGSQTEHVLEFAQIPVVVVPEDRRPGSAP